MLEAFQRPFAVYFNKQYLPLVRYAFKEILIDKSIVLYNSMRR